jgi:hypothetical protein
MKTSTLSISLVFLALFTQGCDSVSDTNQQETDRENVIANTNAGQMGKLKGSFVGTFNGASMMATFDVARATPMITNPGVGQAPQPYLAGDLYVEPSIFVETTDGKPMLIPYSVTYGSFVDGNQLTLSVNVNGSATTTVCSVTNNYNDLDCEWYVNASDSESAHFQLHRLAKDQSLISDTARTQGSYLGTSTYNHQISAIFETREDIQSAQNPMPVISIGGSITKDGRVYTFKGAGYDPINKKLVIPIQGSNNPEINCTVVNTETLSCTWFGRQGLPGTDDSGKDETFTLTKSS